MNKEQALIKIAEEIAACEQCRRWGAGRPVPGEGNADADILFVGEAPGAEEAKTGRPFVGRSGKLLRATIREIGLDEAAIYITSPVKYLPTRGTPSRENIEHSRTHFLKQLAVIDPKIVVLLGSVAALAVLGERAAITKQHGTAIQRDGRTYFFSFHPAAALRFPATKAAFKDDFRKLNALIAAPLQRNARTESGF